MTRRADGELMVVWSGGREGHICPFGRVDMMRSRDNGNSWTWPRTLLDGPSDDRDAGILETDRGTLLATTFSSLAYQTYRLDQALARKEGEANAWPQEKLDRWLSVHHRLTDAERAEEPGCWMIRSTDGGKTWSARYDSIVNSPHGPIQLADGRLLYPGVRLWSAGREVGVCQSTDDGQSWQWLAAIPTRPGDDHRNYHELHGVEAADGTLVVHIRNHNASDNREILQTVSRDGGENWSVPRPIGVWGLPSFLMRLSDQRLLMTYGYRRKPYGNQARISEDAGETWSEPMTISADGAAGDLGYPSTVQLDDQSLVTIWYEKPADSPNAVLRQAHWKIEAE